MHDRRRAIDDGQRLAGAGERFGGEHPHPGVDVVPAGVEGMDVGPGAPGAPGAEVGEVGPGTVGWVSDEERHGEPLVGVLARRARQGLNGGRPVDRHDGGAPDHGTAAGSTSIAVIGVKDNVLCLQVGGGC